MELQDLQNVLNELGLINKKQEKRIRGYETRAQNLTMAYVIFQGLILLSVSLHGSENQCQHWWIPFTISLLCSTIFFIAFLDYVTRFYNTQYHLDLNYMEQQIIYKQIHHKSTKPSSSSSSSSDDNDDHHSIKIKKSYDEILIEPDVVQLLKRKIYITVTLSALIGFAVVVLFACGSFLCGDDGSSSQGLVTLRLLDGKL
ncbi:hypothetical protein Dsin_013894 [Dipteronia sinensis]|uniref:Uncharacterized protein n=1 Tax=Dipteronia sinensis TaxID=43782 RepID=A0AAE0E9J2_9ROSI|nr:hypothetical protein Dsin_013894 [Dipteronia sinensis]